MEKKNIRELSAEDLNEWLQEKGEKPFRNRQLHEWLWQKGARSFEAMSNLSKTLRESLEQSFSLPSISVDTVQRSNDGTMKLRFKTFDNHFVEGVLIPADDRMTACVSSQVGCSLTCAFCATGRMGRTRNLGFDEIFDQVVLLNEESEKMAGRRLTNIVYMGMGEPLLNYSEVMRSIEKVTSPDGLGISPRRITISTAGISKMIRKLADDNVRVRLALSLHAADDRKRSQIMPINEQNNLETLMEALNYFYTKTFNRISFEYILFDKFNDQVEDARQLVMLCKQVPARVNLIEYNTVEGVSFLKTRDDRAQFFCDYLNNHGVMATIRRSRGKDIDAACGQLANK